MKKVRIISNEKVGILENIYNAEIAVIRLEDGTLTTASIEDIDNIPEEEENDRDIITISREEFMKVCDKVTNPLNFVGPLSPSEAVIVSFGGILITNMLINDLFGKKGGQ